MAVRELVICASAELLDGGDGWRFAIERYGESVPAFVVRYAGGVHAYVNRCAHVPVELDWLPGKFFDLTGHYLVCAVHGAHYEAATGRCAFGPCAGRHLPVLNAFERDGQVIVRVDE